jgi:hypothetical protein
MSRLPCVLHLFCLAVFTSGAWANTSMGRGIIVKVDPQGERGQPYIVLRNEFSTPGDREDALVRYDVGKDAVITLDGQKSDFSAFAPGRLVFLCKDTQLFKVFTKTFLFTGAGGAVDAQTAWWTVCLPAGVAQPGATKGGSSDLILQVVARDGTVQKAVALTPAWSPAYGSSAAWHEVDAGALKVAGGRLTGTCAVTLMDRGQSFAEGKPSERHEVTLDLAADGSGSATCDGKALKSVSAVCQAIPAIADDWYCFLRAPDPADADLAKKPDNLRLEIRRRQGAIAQSAFRHGYGKPGPGPAPAKLEATVAEGQMTIRADDGKVAYDLTGFVLGDRVFGTYTAKAGDKTWEGRFSAYLRQADAPSVGWDESTAKKETAALKGGAP